MFERLEQIEAKYDELTQALASPQIVADTARYQKTAKAHSDLLPVVDVGATVSFASVTNALPFITMLVAAHKRSTMWASS